MQVGAAALLTVRDVSSEMVQCIWNMSIWGISVLYDIILIQEQKNCKTKPELLACRHYFFSCWPKSTNEETKSGLCVFVAMHCILVYLTCMFLLNLSGFTPTIYVKKGGLDRPLCYFIAYHRYKNQTDTFSGLTPVLPWLRPTHLRATAVTTHPLKSPSAKKLFFPSSAATQKNVLWSSSQDSL